jgi:hypothetical protein
MRPHTIGTWALSVLVAVGLLGMPGGAWGQGVVGPTAKAVPNLPTPRAAGTAAEFMLALNPFAAQGFTAVDSGLLSSTGTQRFCTSPCILEASFNLPSGAVLTGVEVDAVDTDANGSVFGLLLHCPIGGMFCFSLAEADTGGSATPGSTQIRANLDSPHTVDNGANTYLVEIFLSGGDTTRLVGMRVFYQLQVSPAPAVASFGDVPTSHPFFQFVEALVASGITAGCGGGNFCPDAPLTRGQMATFLSIALGLHFAP